MANVGRPTSVKYASEIISNASSTSSINTTSLMTAMSHYSGESCGDSDKTRIRGSSSFQQLSSPKKATTDSSPSSQDTCDEMQSIHHSPQLPTTSPKRAGSLYSTLSLSPQKKSPSKAARKISSSFNPHSNYFYIETEQDGDITKLEYIKTLGRGSLSKVALCRRTIICSPCTARLFSQYSHETEVTNKNASLSSIVSPDRVHGRLMDEEESQMVGGSPIITQLVAVKILHRSFLTKLRKRGAIRHSTNLGNWSKEISILKRLSNRNTVDLIDVIDDPQCDKVFLIFTYVDGGAVLDLDEEGFVKPHERTIAVANDCFFVSERTALYVLEEERARRYFSNLIDGLIYLHSRHLYHRDLKPENLLVDTTKDTLKISDFGLSNQFVGNHDTIADCDGSPAFFCPERCCTFTELESSYEVKGTSSDIWEAGVCLYVFLMGRVPFVGQSSGAEFLISLYHSIQTDEPVYSQRLSADVKDLLRRLLDKNPNTRISLQEIRHHPWLDKRFHRSLQTEEEFDEDLLKSRTEASSIRKHLLRTVRKSIARLWSPHKDRNNIPQRPKSHSGITGSRTTRKLPLARRKAKSLVIPHASRNNVNM